MITPLLNYLPFGALDGATKVGPSFMDRRSSLRPLSARPGGDKPEGSDPESQIQELQK